MSFDWLKKYMPRTLFGRALVILLFPVIFLQLLVGYVFVQRHYDEVTRQLSRSIAIEINYVLKHLPENTDNNTLNTLSTELGLKANISTDLEQKTDSIKFWDLSGRAASKELRQTLIAPPVLDWVSDPRALALTVEQNGRTIQFNISRSRLNASNPHQFLVMMVLGSIVFVMISTVFLRNQIRPIRRLAAASQAFGFGRVIDYTPTGAYEARQAGQAFLAMRNRIERQIQQRTLMLSGVSHDLRTPLTRLKLQLEFLEPSDEVNAMREDILSMERILNDFLDYAKAGTQQQPEMVNPSEIIRACLNNYARNSNVTYTETISPRAPSQIPLNGTLITRAVDNLINNALRYGEKVQVSLDIAETQLIITVEDDGPGIANADMETATLPFVRLDKARNQNRGGGVGLGLSIVADAAHSHGGRLELGKSELGGLKATIIIDF